MTCKKQTKKLCIATPEQMYFPLLIYLPKDLCQHSKQMTKLPFGCQTVCLTLVSGKHVVYDYVKNYYNIDEGDIYDLFMT